VDGAIAPDDKIRGKQLAMPLYERAEVRAAYLLLAVEENLHGARQRSVVFKKQPYSFEVGEVLPFVICHATAPDAIRPDRWLKGRRTPKGEIADWMDVVMAVDEDRRRSRRSWSLAEDGGASAGLEHDRLEPSAGDFAHGPRCRFREAFSGQTDARLPQVVEQALHHPIAASANVPSG
jgi:hypothetical protein